MGAWPRYATLLFVEPLTESGATSTPRSAQCGEVFAGSSVINEKGLAVTSHLHVTEDTALVFGRPRMKTTTLLWEGVTGRHPRGGTAIYVLFESLLCDAANVEEGIALLEPFPFGPPAYDMRDVEEPGTIGLDVRRCPTADYFHAQGLGELCVESWCNLDYEMARRWGARLDRTTLAGGADRCDFRFRETENIQ